MTSENSNLDQVTTEEWETCIKVLQLACDDPDAVSDMATLTGLVTKLYKSARKQRRQLSQQNHGAKDRALLEASLRCQSEPLDDMNIAVPLLTHPARTTYQQTHKLSRCYICQQKYQAIHFFYHKLCPVCAEYNYAKRQQRTSLKGRVALVTGGRIKVGYEIGLKLLRDGARVIMITRFPHDAAQRYTQEQDFDIWKNQLTIYGLDLRNIPKVENFVNYLLDSESYLDIIINNAAQTVKRPNDFYTHLMAIETLNPTALPAQMQTLLGPFRNSSSLPNPMNPALAALHLTLPATPDFPAGKYDIYGQQLDLRSHNSWIATLEEIGTVELLEVQLVNSVAPFLFNSRLKPLLLKSPHQTRFIINVSSVEGQFSYTSKTTKHPHTNMAKAALNMLTRTSAKDYAQDSIFMNSVDPGWFSQENPYPKKTRLRQKGLIPPLDTIDGAARLYDPIIQGIEGIPLYGQFLKNYQRTDW